MTARVPRWPASSPQAFVDDLLEWMRSVGTTRYDEEVSQVEHALQCAALASRAKDSPCAVAAALLHDVGHLLLKEYDGRTEFLTVDLEHEAVGARWLATMFPAGVWEPIRLHVAAKRYLCTTDPDYRERLSAASIRSFNLQGGELDAGEVAGMESNPALAAAVALRRRDDAAKVPGRSTPGLEEYRPLLESLVQTGTSGR